MHRSASRAASTAGANPERSVPVTEQPGWCTTSTSGSSARNASTALRDLDAEIGLREGWQDVVREGVAPQERLRIGGARSHDGHPRELRAVGAEQRQHGPGVEQNDRSFGELTRDGPVLRRVEVDAGGLAHGRLGRPISVKQAELGLLGQQPPRGAVDKRFRDVAAGDGIDQSVAVADPVGQFDVDAGRQRHAPASAGSAAMRCIVARNGTAQ